MGSAATSPTPWAFVMWNAKGERGRKTSGSGRKDSEAQGGKSARNPSGGENVYKGEVKNCYCGLCVLSMEKYQELGVVLKFLFGY